jgi:hypothetical protein
MNKETLNNSIKLEDYEGLYVPISQHFRINKEGEEIGKVCPNQATGLVTENGVVCGERGCHAAFPKLEYHHSQIRAAGKPFFLKPKS